MTARRALLVGLALAMLGSSAAGSAEAADLASHRPYWHHRRALRIVVPVVPFGYAYGGYGNGPGPGYAAAGYGPGYGYGYAPGYGYIPEGAPSAGFDLGF